jgi:hypothetical protein
MKIEEAVEHLQLTDVWQYVDTLRDPTATPQVKLWTWNLLILSLIDAGTVEFEQLPTSIPKDLATNPEDPATVNAQTVHRAKDALTLVLTPAMARRSDAVRTLVAYLLELATDLFGQSIT